MPVIGNMNKMRTAVNVFTKFEITSITDVLSKYRQRIFEELSAECTFRYTVKRKILTEEVIVVHDQQNVPNLFWYCLKN